LLLSPPYLRFLPCLSFLPLLSFLSLLSFLPWLSFPPFLTFLPCLLAPASTNYAEDGIAAQNVRIRPGIAQARELPPLRVHVHEFSLVIKGIDNQVHADGYHHQDDIAF